MLATTGLRRSELVSLIWEQVDLVSETIRVEVISIKTGDIHPSNKEKLL
ncbi:hypothetical protein [Lysinibacillus sp. NPDC093692]